MFIKQPIGQQQQQAAVEAEAIAPALPANPAPIATEQPAALLPARSPSNGSANNDNLSNILGGSQPDSNVFAAAAAFNIANSAMSVLKGYGDALLSASRQASLAAAAENATPSTPPLATPPPTATTPPTTTTTTTTPPTTTPQVPASASTKMAAQTRKPSPRGKKK